ncbi:hypothetical protein MHYP_G00297360 [Metynnis hypsauchen]
MEAAEDQTRPTQHVTQRQPRGNITEVSSLLEQLYLDDPKSSVGQHDDDDDEDVDVSNELSLLGERLLKLTERVGVLEARIKDVVDSSLSREEGLRETVDKLSVNMKEYIDERFNHLDRSIVDCLHRRDRMWEEKLKETSRRIPRKLLKPLTSSTPAFPTEASSIALNPPSVPPIRMDFPKFGDSTSSSDVTNFIEQCENFLTLRPLSDLELLGTLNAVLQGPARSWWQATKGKIKNWPMFKTAFLEAFLSEDYTAEIEEQLHAMVQAPNQRLRDFAYDYRALCLKWHPEMSEEEMVRRILNACNPRLASGLRGIVSTVDQLVKTGSMIEKDWASSKGYWSRVQSVGAQERQVRKTPKKSGEKHFCDSDLATVQGVPSLLVVPIQIRGAKGDAVLDTGSTYTLMQESLWGLIARKDEDLLRCGNQAFIMADGQESKALGKFPLVLKLQDVSHKLDVYVLKDDSLYMPLLLGLDFLVNSQMSLQPHLGKYTLPNGKSHQFLTKSRMALSWTDMGGNINFYMATDRTNLHTNAFVNSQPEVVQPLLQKWSTVWTETLGSTVVVKHRIITTDEVPVRRRAYRTSIQKQNIIKEHIQKMLKEHIIEPSSSSWAAPVVLVPKPDGSFRFCVDYRGLNAKTFHDAYPMPLVHEILESMQDAAYFSTLDLQSGYWQTPEQHLQHLDAVFTKLHQAQLTLNVKKCHLFQTQITFLGHVVSGRGVEVDPDKVSAICKYPTPTDLKSLQRFLGLVGWYHKFIPNLADTSAPLNNLKKKGVCWEWSADCQDAFTKMKKALQSAPVLAQPRPGVTFQVQTDASDVGLGAVLTQEIEGEEKVIAYASRVLQEAERRYSTSEKECLAVVWAVEKWRHYLEGSVFDIFTDHSTLTWAFNSPKTVSRLTRWTLRLQAFDFRVHYRKGCCNTVPDALSRAPSVVEGNVCVAMAKTYWCDLPTSLHDIAIAQKNSQICEQVKETHQSTKMGRVHYQEQQGVLYRGVPSRFGGFNYQLVVPEEMTGQFLRYFHNSPFGGHLGRMKTLRKILEVAWWPNIRGDVWKYVKECVTCQQYKSSNTKPAGLLQQTEVQKPGEMIGVDFMGPLPLSRSRNTMLMVVVDYYSKWVELFPLKDAKALRGYSGMTSLHAGVYLHTSYQVSDKHIE